MTQVGGEGEGVLIRTNITSKYLALASTMTYFQRHNFMREREHLVQVIPRN